MEGARVRSAWQADRLAGKLWMEAFGGKAGAVNHLNARQAALRDLGARAYCDIMLHASGLLSPGSFTPGIRPPRLCPVRGLGTGAALGQTRRGRRPSSLLSLPGRQAGREALDGVFVKCV